MILYNRIYTKNSEAFYTCFMHVSCLQCGNYVGIMFFCCYGELKFLLLHICDHRIEVKQTSFSYYGLPNILGLEFIH